MSTDAAITSDATPSPSSEPHEIASPRTAIAQQVADHNAALELRRETVRQAARDKFRVAKNLPKPGDATQPGTPAPVSTVPPTLPPAPVSPAPDTQLADFFANHLQQRAVAVEDARREAEQVKLDADRRVQEAEEKLKTFTTNPAAFLADQGINLDQWNARLLNGGEPTSDERLLQTVQAEIEPLRADIRKLHEERTALQKSNATLEMGPLLKADFPLIDAEYGPAMALDIIVAEFKAAQSRGEALPDAADVLANVESAILAKYQRTLQNAQAASKLGFSVPTPTVAPASPSPQTLTNRTTSSVSVPSSGRKSQADIRAAGRELIQQMFAGQKRQ